MSILEQDDGTRNLVLLHELDVNVLIYAVYPMKFTMDLPKVKEMAEIDSQKICI
jgi:hypothetical protein